MRFSPFARSSFPRSAKSPRYVGPRHLMMSSSTPPAVVTSTSTSRCLQRNRSASRTPDEIRFDVNPRKILVRVAARTSGRAYAGSTSASRPTGSSASRHRSIRRTSATACPKHVAWNPVVANASSSAWRSRPPSKSYPRTSGVPSGIPSDRPSTWLAAPAPAPPMLGGRRGAPDRACLGRPPFAAGALRQGAGVGGGGGGN